MKSAPPIQLELRASRILRGGLLLAAVGAISAVLASALAAWLQCALIAAALGYALLAWRQLGVMSGLRLHLMPDRRWRILVPARFPVAATDIEADLLDYSIVGPLIALRLRDAQGRSRNFALAPDSAAPDAQRQLRVWLRVGIGSAASHGLHSGGVL